MVQYLPRLCTAINVLLTCCRLLEFYILATYKVTYQDGYQLVTVSAHGDFIVLPHWETRLLASRPDISQSYYPDTVLTTPCPILVIPNTSLSPDKHSFCKSFV